MTTSWLTVSRAPFEAIRNVIGNDVSVFRKYEVNRLEQRTMPGKPVKEEDRALPPLS
jgi:hypothetical protein